MRAVSIPTAGALAGIGALHAGWGSGSVFPFADRAALTRSVTGSSVPGRGACFAVAGLLTCAAALVADSLPIRGRTRRVGVIGVAVVLGARGAVGVAGRTGAIVPWTPSPEFVQLDRRWYGPLCLILSAGALLSLG